jgi:two-component system OmpR family response regulator
MRRADGQSVRVLFLTAKDAVEDRVAGLTAGGDDYVTEPFSLEEVMAWLRALVRRASVVAAEVGTALVVGDLTLDENGHLPTDSAGELARRGAVPARRRRTSRRRSRPRSR